ncbi:MAG: prepilin peptidase [candidate division Zixibacteria bacterium]|nr:prepilin peptidase [candidate division Zixibacteria bacterium]
MYTLIGIFIFILGLAAGSFLNVCIYRIPLRKSIVFPSSFCPKCGKRIKPYDNIPLFSYIFLKGRCRNCREKISFIYPAVEFISGLAFISLYLLYGLSWLLASHIFLFSALITIFFIDLKFRIIPDIITLPGMMAGLGFSLLTNSPAFLQALIGLLTGGGVLYLIAIIGDKVFKKESMGGGDIKLAAMLGAFLGWQKVLLVFFLASFIGAISGIIILLFSKSLREKRLIPFGPFLAIATLLAVFFGPQLIKSYLNLFSRM